jgi:hypothetical protein
MIVGEQKDTYLGVLDRIQAFEICGEGVDHEDFMLSLGKEAKALRRCLTLRDPTCFNEQVKKINVMLDERLTRYGTFIHSEIASFIIERRNVQAIEEDISEINSKIACINETLMDLIEITKKLPEIIKTERKKESKHIYIPNTESNYYPRDKDSVVGRVFWCIPYGSSCTFSHIMNTLGFDRNRVLDQINYLLRVHAIAKCGDDSGARASYTRLVKDDPIVTKPVKDDPIVTKPVKDDTIQPRVSNTRHFEIDENTKIGVIASLIKSRGVCKRTEIITALGYSKKEVSDTARRLVDRGIVTTNGKDEDYTYIWQIN